MPLIIIHPSGALPPIGFIEAGEHLPDAIVIGVVKFAASPQLELI